MKIKFILTVILLLTFAAAAAAQNRIKIFDPINISLTDYNLLVSATPWGSYKSAEVYLNCSTSEAPTSMVTGPNGGGFVVDNVLTINGRNACGGFCFSTTSDPLQFLGLPVEASYAPVGPFNVDARITGSGSYVFHLIDIGYTYGSTAVYLNTSCQITPVNVPPQDEESNHVVLCHRSNGSRGSQTITVGSGAVGAHLAHGDTLGACEQ